MVTSGDFEVGQALEGTMTRQQSAHQRFEYWAVVYPQRTAVVCGEAGMTYSELNKRANRFARLLGELGIGVGATVGVCFSPQIHTLTCVLAILKCGAAYVPLDPSYPAERLTAMVGQLETMNFVIVSDQTRDRLQDAGKQLLMLDDVLARSFVYSAENLDEEVDGGDLCYVVFTSGTTGIPKAVGVKHSGWSNLLQWLESEYRLDSQSTNLLVSAFGFDISQRSLMTPLYVGAVLCLMGTEHFDPKLAARLIEQHSVRTLHLAPSTLYLLLAIADANLLLASLEYLFIGGEALSAQRIRQWSVDAGKRCRLVHQYGVAECTDVATSYVMGNVGDYLEGGIPMGKPVANCSLLVLDEELAPIGDDEIGEIFIGGAGVGVGYVNNAQLTAEKFVRVRIDGSNVLAYRTGDFARRTPTGEYICLGRRDTQVKIRGMLTNLTDIEYAIKRSFPDIVEAVVLALKGSTEDGNLRLVAFLLHVSEGMPDTLTLTRTLAKKLPRHMVPEDFIEVSQYPLTRNGKIDKQALVH
ncbi:amino acid adenylation domain-containing protein [Burkholderia sp. BCC0405]|uniref:amino acid adenylation domain-containing protein n=1 Tax=Burkholderia sp. BCC0405 TaxID=2676298 RepID=UPI0015898026|nr:amino acid adenylation domain-containing protein [Burkholderia sp. BCC0405]